MVFRKTQAFAAKFGDGGFLSGFLDQFPEGFFADLFAELINGWISGGCAFATDGADARRQAEDAWSTRTERYDRDVFRPTVVSLHLIARAKGQRLNRRQGRLAARQHLDGLRLGDRSEMSEVIREIEAVQE